MKNRTTIALAAAVLLSGVTAASALTVAPKASDSLSLSSAQQKTAWNDMKQASSQSAPAGFNAAAGSTVPNTLTIRAVPSKAARDVPALRPYDFALVNGKLLIVNPHDKIIAEVISG